MGIKVYKDRPRWKGQPRGHPGWHFKRYLLRKSIEEGAGRALREPARGVPAPQARGWHPNLASCLAGDVWQPLRMLRLERLRVPADQ